MSEKSPSYKSVIDKLPFDILAEVFAVELFQKTYKGKLRKEQIVLSPTETFRRRGQKEVILPQSATNQSTYKAGDKYLKLFNSRPGLMDALPESLYLNSELKDPSDPEKTDVISLKEQEEALEKFLLPYEWMMGQLRLSIELWEREMIQRLPTSFVKFWDLEPYLDTLDERKLQALLNLLPISAKIAGNLDLLALALEAILEEDVKVVSKPPKAMILDEDERSNLGYKNNILGEDIILGGSINDGIAGCQVQISNVSPEKIEDFILDGKKRKLLEDYLYCYFVSTSSLLDKKDFTTVSTKRHNEDFTLGEEGYTSILGYTTNFTLING